MSDGENGEEQLLGKKHGLVQLSGLVEALETYVGGTGGGVPNDKRKENNTVWSAAGQKRWWGLIHAPLMGLTAAVSGSTRLGLEVTQPVADLLWDLGSDLIPRACRPVAAAATAAIKGDAKRFRELQRLLTDGVMVGGVEMEAADAAAVALLQQQRSPGPPPSQAPPSQDPEISLRKAFALSLKESDHPLENNLRPGVRGFQKLENGKFKVWMNRADGVQVDLGVMATAPPAPGLWSTGRADGVQVDLGVMATAPPAPGLEHWQKLENGKFKVWMNRADEVQVDLGVMATASPPPGLWSTGSMLLSKRDEVPVLAAVGIYMLRLWGLRQGMFLPPSYDAPPPPPEAILAQLALYDLPTPALPPQDLWLKYVKPVLPLGAYYTKGMSDSPRAREYVKCTLPLGAYYTKGMSDSPRARPALPLGAYFTEGMSDSPRARYVKPVLPLGAYYTKGMSDSPRARDRPVLPLGAYFTKGISDLPRVLAKRQYEALSRILLAGAQEPGTPLAARAAHVVVSLRSAGGAWSAGAAELSAALSVNPPCAADAPVKYAQLFDLSRAVIGTNPAMRTATVGGGRRAKSESTNDDAQQQQIAAAGEAEAATAAAVPPAKATATRTRKRTRPPSPPDDKVDAEAARRGHAAALDALGHCITLLYTHVDADTRRRLAGLPHDAAAADGSGGGDLALQDFAAAVAARCSHAAAAPLPPVAVRGAGADMQVVFTTAACGNGGSGGGGPSGKAMPTVAVNDVAAPLQGSWQQQQQQQQHGALLQQQALWPMQLQPPQAAAPAAAALAPSPADVQQMQQQQQQPVQEQQPVMQQLHQPMSHHHHQQQQQQQHAPVHYYQQQDHHEQQQQQHHVVVPAVAPLQQPSHQLQQQHADHQPETVAAHAGMAETHRVAV
ncbi:hypothetical protein JKP88DRAFT_278031 [Tribonema minus]|uniref:Uncharacterized protein n=1 Tax=Tribonema minus TaxID=303371 RepID=A0A836CDE7_9STRA|nr:hypothetical protein JKP88DRAFT_278031 [Tribonema minus]